MSVIKASGVTHYYGSERALFNFDLEIKGPCIFALLGPNGAGKTTFVKAVLDLVRPQEGDIKIGDIDSKSEKARTEVAYLPEKFNFYPYYTTEGVVTFYGRMKGLKGSELKDAVTSALKKVNIEEIRKKKVGKLSKGQLQRIGIANLLMGENKILILDEPFSGLDPIGVRELKELLKELQKEGKTIFINSHILSEMEKLCDSLALLNKGELLASGKLAELLKDGESLEDFFYKQVNG